MDTLNEAGGLELDSPFFLQHYLEGSRKRPNPSGLSHFPSLHMPSSLSIATSTSNTSHSHNTFVSTLKRSKRMIDLSSLSCDGVECLGDELLRPVALDLAAMVSQPPVGCDPDAIDWESSGLFISSDGGSTSESESHAAGGGRQSVSSSGSGSGSGSRRGQDDLSPPSKIRRNSVDGSAFESWAGLQRVLDADEPRRRSALLSASLPTQSAFLLDFPRASASSSSFSHIGTTTAPNNNNNNNNSSNSNGNAGFASNGPHQPQHQPQHGAAYSYKHTRKLASLASLAKNPAARVLSSAASAAATAAVQSHHAFLLSDALSSPSMAAQQSSSSSSSSGVGGGAVLNVAEDDFFL